jgi:xanthine phosphoribosyltransferase
MIKKYYYSYDEFRDDTQKLKYKVQDFKPEVILAIARGGLSLGQLLSQALNIRNLFTLNSIHYNNTKKLDTFDIFNIPNLSKFTNILIVDDIIDSGESMVEILKVLKYKYPNCNFKIATLFTKQTALIQPDYYIKEANQWIEFFWEIDIK